MSIYGRLRAIEQAVLQHLAGADDRERWRELRTLFCAESVNAGLFAEVATLAGTRRLPDLLRLEPETEPRLLVLVGDLRRSLGRFCRRERIACPAAALIKVRRIPGVSDRSCIIPAPEEGRFLQLWECE